MNTRIALRLLLDHVDYLRTPTNPSLPLKEVLPHEILNYAYDSLHHSDDTIKAALNALRSYQYGNDSKELAREVADRLEEEIMK